MDTKSYAARHKNNGAAFLAVLQQFGDRLVVVQTDGFIRHPSRSERALRLLDILMDGLRYRQPAQRVEPDQSRGTKAEHRARLSLVQVESWRRPDADRVAAAARTNSTLKAAGKLDGVSNFCSPAADSSQRSMPKPLYASDIEEERHGRLGPGSGG